MPIGPFGEIVGTTNCLEGVSQAVLRNYKTKVQAPKNPKVVSEDDQQHKLSPSVYLFQMSMSTEQKLANTRDMRRPRKIELLDMSDTTHQKVSQVDVDDPLFQPFPSEIFFQRCEPFQIHEVPLILRNNDKVPRLVKVVQADSPYFKIIAPLNCGDKVGPGLPTVYKIQFTPEAKRDYDHELICITERERFVVPVKAIGARAVLDFPDTVKFGNSPVKYPTQKTLLVRNIGDREAKYTLTVDKPYSVNPPNGILPINETMQVTIEFNPAQTGDQERDLLLKYDTGETVAIQLHGTAQDANVRLDKSSLRIEDTFLGMANQRVATIFNRSDVIVHYRWTKFATKQEEDMHRARLIGDIEAEEKQETDRFLEECIEDPTLRDKMSVISRTFQNRKKLTNDDNMVFSDDVVRIEPVEGDIWPNSSAEVTIIFKPDKAQTYTRTAFCDITGRESRLPLRVTGSGMGPKVLLSIDRLDMGNIFIHSSHVYEIVMANKGDIDAIYSLQPAHTPLGRCFTFNPAESIIMPGAHQAINVHFSCPVLGAFEEDFYFLIDGQPEKAKVTFTGTVIGPTFHFDVDRLKFGTVAYGFVSTLQCLLTNTALVPMTFRLRIPEDESRAETVQKHGRVRKLSEFEITPNAGTLQPQSSIKIQIDLCSYSVKKYETSLVIDVDSVGTDVMELPILAKCIVPQITVTTPILDFKRCFLRHPYELKVGLQNDTELPARYEVMAQDINQSTPITHSSSQPKGIIAAHSLLALPVMIQAQQVEENEVTLHINVIGSKESPLSVTLRCIGEGPVVHIIPMDMNLGEIPVLTDVSRTLRLTNESLIPAKFTAHTLRADTVFKIEPQQGEIAPEEMLDITVTANVDDMLRFQDKIQINILESQSQQIPVEAYGFGTTIVTSPAMGPYLNLGPQFSNSVCEKVFRLTNRGRRLQQLVWNTDGFPLTKPKRDPSYNPKDIKYKGVPALVEFPEPIFKLTPSRIELASGASIDVVLRGCVTEPQIVKERLLCHSIIGRQGGKQLIMKVDLHAEFITPLLSFSADSIFFRVDKEPWQELETQVRHLDMTNISQLPLTVHVKLGKPFSMALVDGSEVHELSTVLGTAEVYTVTVKFDPAYKDDLHIRRADEVMQISYDEHPHVDYIAVRGEVYFPNLAFEKTTIDFGCILNDSEVTRYINITNNSPMDVKYKWSFLVDEQTCPVRHRRQIPAQIYAVDSRGPNPLTFAEGFPMEQQPVDAIDDELKDKDQEKNMAAAAVQLMVPAIEITKTSFNESEAIDGKIAAAAAGMDTAHGVSQPADSQQPSELQPHGHSHDVGNQHDTKVDDEIAELTRPKTRMGMLVAPPVINSTIRDLLEGQREDSPLGIEEVFDILPLYGLLKPGETEQITMTFYGHSDTSSIAIAQCDVEGGPTYEVKLMGQSSLVEYRLDATEVDFGQQMYDQVASATITIMNLGTVGFEFQALNMDPANSQKPLPGVPAMCPHKGYIKALEKQEITIKFLPGIPDTFKKSFQIQVAHFEPETITVFCDGIFPRISLDLPRYIDPMGIYEAALAQAKENLSQPAKKADILVLHDQLEPESTLNSPQREIMLSEQDIQNEVERLAVKQFAEALHISRVHDVRSKHAFEHDAQGMIGENSFSSKPALNSSLTEFNKHGKVKKQKPRLPDYLLDFGYVILGTVRTHVVQVTNTGIFPVSFSVDHTNLSNTGFSVELDRVKQLPGAPHHEKIDFVVSFDPRGANLELGTVEAVVPINVVNGPLVNLHLMAHVTMPDMQVSTDVLEFGDVKCGDCQIITIQIYNHKHVRCDWSTLPTEKELKAQASQIDKHTPMHLRRKIKPEKPKPKIFEFMPAEGTLLPGQRINVQVKFMPTDEKKYEQRLTMRLAQSSQRVTVLAKGQGLEPRLEFARNLVEFGPILPHSPGDEQDVVIKNPCSFPIEFYNLEFDRQFLEEEKILRLMRGYDEYGTILLPPRQPHDKLPEELLNFYEEQVQKLEEVERQRKEAEAAAAATAAAMASASVGAVEDGSGAREPAPAARQASALAKDGQQPKDAAVPAPATALTADQAADQGTAAGDMQSKVSEDEEDKIRNYLQTTVMGDLDITPVSAAIARHLGVDLTLDGKAARNRRGIALIVHGAPLSGKTSTAVALAKYYDAALLTLDAVVLEAISNGNTPAGLKARELCSEAAHRRAEESKAEAAGAASDETKAAGGGGGLSVEALQAHTAGQAAQLGATHSMTHGLAGNRKTMSILGKPDKHGKPGAPAAHAAGGAPGDNAAGSQVPSSPPPMAAPIACKLSVSASIAGEDGLVSCVLPEELLCDVVAERLQLNDCHQGVVFDGLESMFCQNMTSAAQCILKCFNNRKYMYFINLKMDYNALKEREKKEQEERERKERVLEEEERQRLEEMDEDEYDALSEEKKAAIDRKRLEIKKQRLKRELEEKMEKERLEREKQEAEARRAEEEKQSKKKKKGDKDKPEGKEGKDVKEGGKQSIAAKPGGKAPSNVALASERNVNKSQGGKKPDDSAEHGAKLERPESHMTFTSGDESDKKKKGKLPKDEKRAVSTDPQPADEQQQPAKEVLSEAERLLIQRFKTFEFTLKDVTEIVDRWDRTVAAVRPPPTPTEGADAEGHHGVHLPSGKKGKGAKEKEKADKEKHKEQHAAAAAAAAAAAEKEPAQLVKEADGGADGDEAAGGADHHHEDENVGVPSINIDCTTKDVYPSKSILSLGKLPMREEILDGLGLGPRGPPIPPPATFAVVVYPNKRKPATGADILEHYAFVASSPDDPNVVQDDKSKDGEAEEEKSATPDNATPTGKKGKDKREKEPGAAAAEQKKEKRKVSSADKKKPARKGSVTATTPPPGAQTPASEAESARLSIFRWVVPANGEVVVRLRFQSEDLGQYDQTLNFEITSTRRRYQLYCRGTCAFPTISREPRVVFPHRKNTKKADEIVHKKYILSTDTFEFGPLLAGQNRDTMKAGRFPQHTERLSILNTSPLDADVSFCFLEDSKGDTFMLDPPMMMLKPGESQELTVYAFPRSKEYYEDSLICCIKENPEPVIFKVSCTGCRPELEVDKKVLQFDKVLLHRKDTKTIFLRNSSLIPVGWRLSGLENLGEDFSVSVDSGIVEPRTEFALQAHFRATKPVVTTKKSIRLEILDSDDQYGIVEVLIIHVHAEAYDVALDMSFPKGTDGGIEFGTVRVGEEARNQLSLKNKGKYEIEYNFTLENVDPNLPDMSSLFSIQPQKGTLTASDRPTQVQIAFKSKQELHIKDLPILRCQVNEPNLAEGERTIASIPVKLSVRSLFSKYNISPKADINFGPLLVNFRKTRTLTVENTGQFDFKYTITKAVKKEGKEDTKLRPTVRGEKGEKLKSRDGSSSGRSAQALKPRRAESLRQDVGGGLGGGGGGGGQSRLQLGMFTIYPAFGVVLAGNHQTVTVDCIAENTGKFDEDISIDITERDPTDSPSGIPYRLLAEVCSPGIDISNINSIFEEHRICKSLSQWQQQNKVASGGTYGEAENRFLFSNVIVGHTEKARFKVSNVQKVPCDLTISMKPVSSKLSSKNVDVFEVDPPRVQIPAHSHAYATVSFTPTAMQHYSAIFEAAIEGVPQAQAKTRSLVFEMLGDGNMPRITIKKPSVRNKKGHSVLLFKKRLVGKQETLPLVLLNEGTLPSRVYIDITDCDSVFTLLPTQESRVALLDEYADTEGALKLPHTCAVLVDVGKAVSFDVTYRPTEKVRSQANIHITVEDNQYEDSIVQLIGEGYYDDVTLDNVHGVIQSSEPADEEGNMADDDVAAAKANLVKFGDCAINEPRSLSFTMTNHSRTECVRFQWPEHANLKFSPSVGHIHAGLHKDMTVTFKTDKPVVLNEEVIHCQVSKITFQQDTAHVADWDDRQQTVKWVDVTAGPGVRPAKKKVIDIEPEPPYTEVPDSSRALDLLVSANSDYSKFETKLDVIKFKDTLLFQSRIFEFQLVNKGSVQMDFSWQVVMEDTAGAFRSVTFAAETVAGENNSSRLGAITPSVVGDLASYVPFTVEPSFGTVAAKKKATISVKFSPLDIQDYEGRLLCTIPNLEKDKQGPVIGLKARSLLPYCHFELEDSDYITAARRNPELRGPKGAPPGTALDPNTRVIEFSAVGVNVKNTRAFSIVNPTSEQYHFNWINEDEPDARIASSFSCGTPTSVVKAGKKHEIQFYFTPKKTGITESFWRFDIPEHCISIPFLLIGDTRDPEVFFEKSHFNFKSLLIGHEAKENIYIVNNEDSQFPFSFDEASLQATGYKNKLSVEPISGVLQPRSRLPVMVRFTPTSEAEVNFNVVCNVKRKMDPLRMNMKAEGYGMSAVVICEDSTGNRIELTSEGQNEIAFGHVEINEESIRNITIFNSGKFNFDYEWCMDNIGGVGGKATQAVTVTPANGMIAHGESTRTTLAFCPRQRMLLNGCELALKISHGPEYLINVTGSGVLPGVHFSFLSHNFGPCFIYRAGMPQKTAVLRLTNRESKDISVDCLNESTNHLHHNFEAQVIPANHHVDITFTFYPREAKKYRDIVEFEINSLSRQTVEILGQGTEMKIEVAHPSQKIVKFGALREKQVIKKQIPLVNNSPSPITFQLSCTPTTAELQEEGVLKVHPTQAITLQPRGGTCKVDVVFSPKKRVPQFTEEVMLECAGMFQPVFVITGCCHGIQIDLDTEAIAFGSVVQKSQSGRKLVMTNSGDVGAAFKWEADKFKPDFSIEPISGYISPGMEVSFEVLFHPHDINADIRYDGLRCFIEGASPLKLTLSGMCTGVPAFKEVQHFTTHVRNKEVKNLMVINRTNQLWQLKPVIDGEYWSGADWFVVEPQQSKPYELTYYPLTMTAEGKKHNGTVFFPLPDGNGLLYNLVGTATEPKMNGKVHKDVPAKTAVSELLPITNWLKKPQRFRVKIEPVKPDKFDIGTTLKGLDYIDVPPNGKRDYKLTFYAYKDSLIPTQCKVTFTNEVTGEYQWFEVTFKVFKGGAIDVISLTTLVRQSIHHTITIKNPLVVPATFAVQSCTIPEIMLPNQLSIPPESEGFLSLEFLPLTIRTQTGKLELVNVDLGQYLYELECTSSPAGPEKALYFRTTLGSSQVLTAKFLNYAKQKAEYTCKIDNSTDFTVEKTINAVPASSGGTEMSVDVAYEPCSIGDTRTTLTISSPVGGDYTFPIFASCVTPKPQGPFIVKAGSTTSITFKNIFAVPTAFTFQVDNPAFHVTKAGENVRAKKEHRIVVGYDGNDSGTRAPVMGKLVVSCAGGAGSSAAAVQWVYYLKGVIPDK